MKKTFQLASLIALVGLVTIVACKKKDDGPKYKEGWNADSVVSQKNTCMSLLTTEQCDCSIPKVAETMTYSEYKLTLAKLVLQDPNAKPLAASEASFVSIAANCGVDFTKLGK